MRKIYLTEAQFRYCISEDIKRLNKASNARILNATTDTAKDMFGDEYGQENTVLTNRYFKNVGRKETVNKDLDVPTGIFSLGNAKLSDDTLILNFTSALGCPSINRCPISQAACFGAAGEDRLPMSRRKNLIIQQFVAQALKQGKMSAYFNLARLYVEEFAKTKHPVRFIRYNEIGDFPNQKILVMAAQFSDEMKQKYGIISMAYTAKDVDPTEIVNGKSIDQIIKINRSRNDIPHSEGSVVQNFHGIPMNRNGFSADPNTNLENAYCDVCEVTTSEAERLKVETPLVDKETGLPSIPLLHKGSWDGGSGYYYVCPCSFWRYNKLIATEKFLQSRGILGNNETLPDDDKIINKYKKNLSDVDKKALTSILNKVKSPCGVQCAVCHDMKGGVDAEDRTVDNIKDYTVVTATHGAGKEKYKKNYAIAKRNGDDSVKYSKTNPRGVMQKYFKTDAPIRKELVGENKK